jgi:hypothetical protein
MQPKMRYARRALAVAILSVSLGTAHAQFALTVYRNGLEPRVPCFIRDKLSNSSTR